MHTTKQFSVYITVTIRINRYKLISRVETSIHRHEINYIFFFLNDPPPTEIYPLPLPAPFPIRGPPNYFFRRARAIRRRESDPLTLAGARPLRGWQVERLPVPPPLPGLRMDRAKPQPAPKELPR